MNLVKLCRNQWDRTLAIVLVVGGFAALLVGWLAVSGTIFTFEQIPYVISGAVVGIALIGIGLTSWLSADLRDEWRKLDRLERLLEGSEASNAPDASDAVDGADTPDAPAADDSPAADGNGAANHRIAAPGTRR